MLFNSIDFLLFFPIVLIVYFLVPIKIRKYILLIASYYFYMCWNPKYVVLIMISTISTWFFAILIERVKEGGKKLSHSKIILIVAISVNLSLLGFFKYYSFVFNTFSSIISHFNISIKASSFDIILPVGISFYTFQALSYVIDVYRGDITAERNILQYALFVSFFPQLVAGPIEKSSNLLKQIQINDREVRFDTKRVVSGMKLMLFGYFLKMVIADRVAIYVNSVFENYNMYNSSILIVASIFFAFQIYCDFNSYSLIAKGSARILGYELMDNFDAPYFSQSVSEFWRRWHISLNRWFVDYLYIPLGGGRVKYWKGFLNILIVFSLSGLWHGASWTYVLWGIINGFYLIVERITSPLMEKINEMLHTKKESFSYYLLRTIKTFVLVDVAWIFFRATTISDAINIIKRIFLRWDPWSFNGNINNLLPIGVDAYEMRLSFFYIAILFIIDAIKYYKNESLERFLSKQCLWFEWGAYLFLLLSILVFGVYGSNFQSVEFLYFQF